MMMNWRRRICWLIWLLIGIYLSEKCVETLNKESGVLLLAKSRMKKLIDASIPSSTINTEGTSPTLTNTWIDVNSNDYVQEFEKNLLNLISSSSVSTATKDFPSSASSSSASSSSSSSSPFYSSQRKRTKSWRTSSGLLSRFERTEGNLSEISSESLSSFAISAASSSPTSPSSSSSTSSFELENYLLEREIPQLLELLPSILTSRNISNILSYRENFGSTVKVILREKGKYFLRCDLNHSEMVDKIMQGCMRTLNVNAAISVFEMLSLFWNNKQSLQSDAAKLENLPPVKILRSLFNLLNIAKSRNMYRDGKKLFESSIPLILVILAQTTPHQYQESDRKLLNKVLFAILKNGLSIQLRCLLMDLKQDISKSSLINSKSSSNWSSVRSNILAMATIIHHPLIDNFLQIFINSFLSSSQNKDNDHDRFNQDLLATLSSIGSWKTPDRDLISLIIVLLHQFGLLLPEKPSTDQLQAILSK